MPVGERVHFGRCSHQQRRLHRGHPSIDYIIRIPLLGDELGGLVTLLRCCWHVRDVFIHHAALAMVPRSAQNPSGGGSLHAATIIGSACSAHAAGAAVMPPNKPKRGTMHVTSFLSDWWVRRWRSTARRHSRRGGGRTHLPLRVCIAPRVCLQRPAALARVPGG